MTPTDAPSGTTLHAATGMAAHAGTMLRDGRVAAGWSLDMVAQQLKLAPRQVQALEDGDYAGLPGRTFVRGFARNYARLLGLDPDSVLQALPGPTGDAALESPTLHPTAVKIGELPSGGHARPRRVASVVLVVIVLVVAAVFGYRHYRGDPSAGATAPRAPAAVRQPPANAAAPATAPGAGTPADAAPGATPLRDPVVSPPLDSGSGPAPDKSSATTGDLRSASAATTNDGSIAPLSITARGTSWIEVRDGSGRTVLSGMVAPGQSHALAGAPPFDVVIGNAPDVTLSYRGQPVDVAPYIRQNVARLRLQ